MRIHFDERGKARCTVSAHEARLMEGFARRRGLPAVFTVEEEGELTAPWIILRLEKATSATVPAKRWDSTSFRLEEHQRLRFKELCHENGETTCQVIRAFIDYYIESHQRSLTRRSIQLVRGSIEPGQMQAHNQSSEI